MKHRASPCPTWRQLTCTPSHHTYATVQSRRSVSIRLDLPQTIGHARRMTTWAVIADGVDGTLTAVFSNEMRPPEVFAAGAVLWELQRTRMPLPDVRRGLNAVDCLQACGYRIRAIVPVAPAARA